MALRPASSLPRCQGAPLVLHGHPLARERASSASPPPPRCCAVPRLAEGRNAAGRLLGLQAAPPPRQRRLSAPATRHRRWSARRARLVSLGGRRAISHQGIMRRRAQGGKVDGAWPSRAAGRCQRRGECGGGPMARRRRPGCSYGRASRGSLAGRGAAGVGGCLGRGRSASRRTSGAGRLLGRSAGRWVGLSLMSRPAQPPARAAKTGALEGPVLSR